MTDISGSHTMSMISTVERLEVRVAQLERAILAVTGIDLANLPPVPENPRADRYAHLRAAVTGSALKGF